MLILDLVCPLRPDRHSMRQHRQARLNEALREPFPGMWNANAWRMRRSSQEPTGAEPTARGDLGPAVSSAATIVVPRARRDPRNAPPIVVWRLALDERTGNRPQSSGARYSQARLSTTFS
jgi:hypothetical protein